MRFSVEQRTRVIGVFQAEERVDCGNILHQRRSDQSEQQRVDVVNVVYVSDVDMSVLERTTVLCADVQVACLCSVQLDLVRDQ